MKIIGFNIEELHAKKSFDFKRVAISTDILFTEVEKAKLDVLKDSEALKISFKFTVAYKDSEKKDSPEKNEVLIQGSMLLMVSKDESKEFLKSWKNKEIPKDKALGLYNVILKKCSVKALQLEDEIGLSPHIPFPQIRTGQQQNQ
ncbi:MAG: hypothetical protein AABY16_02260 [Nanoarchaeota archaeon]